MSLIAKQSDNEFTLAPAGTHLARCVQLIDMGTQYSEYYKKSSHKILIGWELPTELDGDSPFLVWKRYTCSLSKKSNLFRDLESWRCRPFAKEELEGFKLAGIVGAPCMLTIVHNETQTDQGPNIYANVGTVSGVIKGLSVPDQVHPTIIYDIDDHDEVVFQTFSDNLRATINKAAERNGNVQQNAAVEDRFEEEVPAEDDQVPF
jgi:hypothetical protein